VRRRFAARLDATPTAPADLRRRLSSEFAIDDAARDEVVLIASELATNAVLHGKPPIDVRVTIDPELVRVEVHDEHPDMRQPAEGSRGLMLVDRIARAWGVSYQPGDGKVVWAEIPLRSTQR
jgi:anti-sigma regulatory factor (Ser/Thr protein kinase)